MLLKEYTKQLRSVEGLISNLDTRLNSLKNQKKNLKVALRKNNILLNIGLDQFNQLIKSDLIDIQIYKDAKVSLAAVTRIIQKQNIDLKTTELKIERTKKDLKDLDIKHKYVKDRVESFNNVVKFEKKRKIG